MDANLIIDDAYVEAVGRRSRVRGKELQDIMNSYVAILSEIETEAITRGNVAKAVTAYKECVMLLQDKLTEISTQVEEVTDGFLVDVNDADDYLF